MNAKADRRPKREPDPAVTTGRLIAVGLFVVGFALTLVDSFSLWPLTLTGALISAFLLWGAVNDEPIAGPVVGLCATATPPMFVADQLAVGALAAVVVAIVLGEHLAACRAARYRTPGTDVRSGNGSSLGVHALAATWAIVLTLAATLLPELRLWSMMAIAALVALTVVLHQRRRSTPAVPLPPPTPVTEAQRR